MMHDISQKISEIKQNNQKLEQYNAELEAINDLLSETNIKLRKSENSLKKSITIKEKFLAIISHDVRSPLTTLKGYLNLLSSAPEMISEEKKAKTIESIKSTVDLQLNLLSNMVEWARSQMGEIKFSPEIISLYEVSYSNIKLFNPMAYNKNIIIKSEISDAAVLADRNMLELIFRNLLSNAIKFSYPNSVICIFSEKLDIHTIKIVVRDTGVGISAKNLKSILKTNNFTTSEGTENEKGTGFGLLFCKEFVERNGGEIHIESQEDKGTTVSFTLKRMLQPKMNFKKLIFASNHHYHSSY
jgi:signal transduction histidine kinase